MVQGKERYVESGRVAYIGYGDDKGKLCVIVDVIDQNRVLVEGPCSNVARKQMNLKALQLTTFRLNVPASCRQKVIKKNWEKDNITEKWNNSTWAKKIAAREKRETLTDFDRFKLMKAKQARNRLVNIEFGKLRKAAKKSGGKKK
ncbi:large ribosomal subunit protein eL14-like [Ruditapes philippinarum]|uniref:large ribosomal subunit protein eL14-like n=1 Tax=Ruditapes philippinarum TaxID=129788 RepID=UPI00295BB444|nr:large ribosomal subunit protein eL14-like [Ruditapes philippinarum]